MTHDAIACPSCGKPLPLDNPLPCSRFRCVCGAPILVPGPADWDRTLADLCSPNASARKVAIGVVASEFPERAASPLRGLAASDPVAENRNLAQSALDELARGREPLKPGSDHVPEGTGASSSPGSDPADVSLFDLTELAQDRSITECNTKVPRADGAGATLAPGEHPAGSAAAGAPAMAAAGNLDSQDTNPIPGMAPVPPDGGAVDGTPFSATFLSSYEFVRKLGEGGMGAVFLMRQAKLDRLVAVKIVRTAEVTEDQKRRLLKEARVLAGLNHPNILSIHDVGEDGETPYLVCEYVDGEPLADRRMLGQGLERPPYHTRGGRTDCRWKFTIKT